MRLWKTRAWAATGALFFSVLTNVQAHPVADAASAAPTTAPVSTAQPSAHAPAFAERGPNCVGEVAMHTSVVVPLGKSTMVDLPEPVRTRTVGNPSIVQAMLVSPRTLYLLGSDIGTTNMIVQGRSGACSVIDVVVGADPDGLQHVIHELMPGETDVQVKVAADTLVLTGTISDAVKAQRVLELANAFVQRPVTPLVTAGHVAPAAAPAAAAAASANGPTPARVINMMRIAAPQQVLLQVKVAEVSKTLIDQLGASPNIQGAFGSWSVGLLANFLSGGMSSLALSKANNRPLSLLLDAEKDEQLVKILAQPNLMAISGQEASFLAGGKVFIPVPQSNGFGGTTITLQAEQFGIGLTFTPTVLENGRINLKVAPEVSELSSTGAVVTASNSTATSVLPLITTRRASTTVQLYDGQSFAIGGLIKDNVTGAVKAIPGIGELPIIGALARSTNYQADKTELVFVVTPHLAKPLPPDYPMPTDHFGAVNEAQVYATTSMEGHVRPEKHEPTPAHPASTPVSVLPVPPAPATTTQPTAAEEPAAPALPEAAMQSTPSATPEHADAPDHGSAADWPVAATRPSDDAPAPQRIEQ